MLSYFELVLVVLVSASCLLLWLRSQHKHHRLLLHIVAHADIAVSTATPDFIITSWNPAAERALGYTAAEIIGKSAAMLVPANLLDDVMAARKTLFRDDSAGPWETVRIHKNGSEIPLSLMHTLFRDAFGIPSSVVSLFRDLTPAAAATAELRILAERLAHKSERLDEAQRLAQVGSWEGNPATGTALWSAEMHHLFGTDPVGFAPSLTNFLAYVHPADRTAVCDAFSMTSGADEDRVIVHRVVTAAGQHKIVEQRWRNQYDASGEHVSAFGTCQDISEQHSAQQAINQLAVRLTNTLESITDVFYVVDTERRFTYVNPAAAEFFEKSAESLIGTKLWDALPAGAQSRPFGEQVELAAITGAPVYRETIDAKGEWFDVRIFPTADGLGIHFRNVTQRHRAGAVLRAFARRVESVQEVERSAIAREIHDQVGQALTALRMDATRLQRNCAGNAAALSVIAEMTQVIDVTLQTTRSIALALHPMVLEDLGLAAAIEMHVGHVAQRANLKAVLDLGESEPVVGRAAAAVAYRVLQESLTNVVRHAKASEISVSLAVVGGNLVMEVADNGRGIEDAELEKNDSLGLVGMRERAAALDGRVTIRRMSPSGTQVTLHLPNVGSLEPGLAG